MNKTVGILGGGQLARMMALEAHRLGIKPIVFGTKEEEPAAKVTPYYININATPPYFTKKHKKTLNEIPYLTFESEFFDVLSIKELFTSLKINTQIYPHPDLMTQLQKRSLQKKILSKWHIPTSPWLEATGKDLLYHNFLSPIHIKNQFNKFNQVLNAKNNLFHLLVIKKDQGGYDGYGTFFYSLLKKSHHFKKQIQPQDYFIIEPFINFKRELAITFVRTKTGQIIELPLVETKQKAGKCDWVIGPTHHPALKSLTHKIKIMLAKEHYMGAITFELFDTGTHLYVNEIAPRVHNSAHYSLTTMGLNQFSLHILTPFLIKKIKLPLSTPHFAMVNLIGTISKKNIIAPNIEENVFLHWYDKQEEKPGRKMGHLTGFSFHMSHQLILKKLLKLRNQIKTIK